MKEIFFLVLVWSGSGESFKSLDQNVGQRIAAVHNNMKGNNFEYD